MARPHLQLVEVRTTLWRLADDEFVTLGHHALPLRQNFELVIQVAVFYLSNISFRNDACGSI